VAVQTGHTSAGLKHLVVKCTPQDGEHKKLAGPVPYMSVIGWRKVVQAATRIGIEGPIAGVLAHLRLIEEGLCSRKHNIIQLL
jgi:hypothetical protein